MAMTEQEQIEQAISVLESQRQSVGDLVVNTTIAALQEKLSSLQDISVTQATHLRAERKQVTTLFANIVGLPDVSEPRRDTNLLDILRVLWRRLDGAISEQGGVIDKHMGDGVMGLFGIPKAREDDPERAIRAALAMRSALADFVDEISSFDNASLDVWRKKSSINDTKPFANIQIRVGINTGPVLLDKVGSSDEHTAIGSAVNIASRLEQSAPLGAILISHETYLLVPGIFTVEPLGPIEIRGRSEAVEVYLVTGINPRALYPAIRAVEGIKTQMVGRSNHLLQLQNSLQLAAQSRTGRKIVIRGEAGMGKSRLVHEFMAWIGSQQDACMIMNGRTDQRMSYRPYSLIRDLLATHFNIQDSDSATLVENKLARGMAEVMDQHGIDFHDRAHAVGQFIGLSVSARAQAQSLAIETPQVRNRVFNYITQFIEALATRYPAMVIILEDVHWADSKSLELIEALAEICERSSLLLICLTRSQAAQDRLYGSGSHVIGAAIQEIELEPLSDDETRQLVIDILRRVPDLPNELCSLIVTKAEGNPFYVEELVKVLIEDGVIVTSQDAWRIQECQFREVRVPPTLTGVLQARLDRLSSLERTALQQAAVIGRVFWDSAVVRMGEMADQPLFAAETMIALEALEKRELIFRQKSSGFAGTVSYLFKHAILRDVTYESVLLRHRPKYHKLAADWLAEQSGERISEYAGLIAEHYQQAGEITAAAKLFETAAVRAQAMYNPDVAIDYFQKALSLLSDESHFGAWQLSLQRQCGELLLMQARLVEAAQIYMTMQYIGEQEGDLAAQAHALNGQAIVYREQAEHETMQRCARQAEQAASLAGHEEELVCALLHQADASVRLGDGSKAIAAARQAQQRSSAAGLATLQSMSLNRLCLIEIESGSIAEANTILNLLEQQAESFEDDNESRQHFAFSKAMLGELYNRLGQYNLAAFSLLGALDAYREIDFQQAIAQTLNALGETARLRDDASAAVPLYQEALAIASAIGDRYGRLTYRTNLGGALAKLGQYESAIKELRKVTRLSNDVARVVNWLGLSRTYSFMAEAFAGLGEMADALTVALQSHLLAQQTGDPLMLGAAWRVLGKVAAQLPAQELPIVVDNTPYSPPSCFSESLSVLRDAASNTASSLRQQAETMFAWAEHEIKRDNIKLAEELKAEAHAMTTRLGEWATKQLVPRNHA